MGGAGSRPWEKGWNPWVVENRINGAFMQRKISQPFYNIILSKKGREGNLNGERYLHILSGQLLESGPECSRHQNQPPTPPNN